MEWDVTTADGFFTCYRATVGEVYGYAGLLCGRDRATAEALVGDVYLAALRRARTGEMATLTLGDLRKATRHRWIGGWRAGRGARRRATAPAYDDSHAPATTADVLADLPAGERAAMVMRYVNNMPVNTIADQMGVSGGTADGMVHQALRRLGLVEVQDG